MKTLDQNSFMRNVAKVIRAEVKKHMYSNECVECGTEDKFFDDSCQFVELVAAMNELATYLENGARYNEILNK